MSEFLVSEIQPSQADEILAQNVLTMAYLRSLIPGDFHLEYLREDYLLLHEKGIFVIKQCHKNGMIYGQKDDQLWSELNYLGDEQLFSNPLMDNDSNIKKLMGILKLPKSDFHSCILFDAQCELRNVPGNTEQFSIMRADQLERFFAELPQRPVRYTHTQLEALNDIFLLVSANR